MQLGLSIQNYLKNNLYLTDRRRIIEILFTFKSLKIS
jgi:hypothetical protein